MISSLNIRKEGNIYPAESRILLEALTPLSAAIGITCNLIDEITETKTTQKGECAYLTQTHETQTLWQCLVPECGQRLREFVVKC